MKAIVFCLFFLASQSFLTYSDTYYLVKNGRSFLTGTSRFSYKDFLDDSWEGDSENYPHMLFYIQEIVDSVNVSNNTHWEVEKKSVYDLPQVYSAYDSVLQVSGEFICLIKEDNKMIFYAEGEYRPKSLLFKLSTLSFSPIEGKAFFIIQFCEEKGVIDHKIRFYLTTQNKIVNFYLKNLVRRKARKIFLTTVNVFKTIAKKEIKDNLIH